MRTLLHLNQRVALARLPAVGEHGREREEPVAGRGGLPAGPSGPGHSVDSGQEVPGVAERNDVRAQDPHQEVEGLQSRVGGLADVEGARDVGEVVAAEGVGWVRVYGVPERAGRVERAG